MKYMKGIWGFLYLMALVLSVAGCAKAAMGTTAEPEEPYTSADLNYGDAASCATAEQKDEDAAALIAAPDGSTDPVTEENKKQQIRVSAGEKTVVFELNESAAAKSLCQQLPLTTEVENYGQNEKIFYLPENLDITDTPQAASGAGTLAYYAPWGDVVMFYGDYSPNGKLYELGQAVSGSGEISSLSGTLQIEKAG
ncbi:cyclophilin-like fold protein [[Clostridium] symbiosum]|uniref:cyclophilin-like fold protein n=1 Tax=Clostridium symbiosum TaxID=1512 RepID=UPI001D07C38A|nr:cyclophilin-like fold protein [[Clostridium] symbiosum]MCB6610772.1 hypothetical protein [[Clostridium] symbiosum]MCB6931749.1 hypothetical protein [[Clostridium] symbiosum]